jgi:hypothetical protein
LLSGVITIPAQSWGTDLANQEKEDVQNPQPAKDCEEDIEAVAIRRVGFVFQAYNVEYWCVNDRLFLFHSIRLLIISRILLIQF